MRTIVDLAYPDSIATTMVILLPPAYGTVEDFQREGFITAIRQRALGVDIVLVDMNLELITSHTALPLLHDTIIKPARKAGYTNIILTGISIGGFMAISYADRYPDNVDGLMLLAPYLGNRMVTDEIINCGGIHHWSPGQLASDDYEQQVWRWLKHNASHFVIQLGYGSDDRFAATHACLASILSPQQITVMPGGHDWSVWRNIWNQFLDKNNCFQLNATLR